MTRVFISYSHKDEEFRAELDGHMALLRREQLVDIWSDHCIRPGEALDPAISAELEAADLVLMLVSKDFIQSNYCFDVEMTRALARHAAGEAEVVPIILRPCDWESSPLGKLKALPKDAKPVTKWPSFDDAFLDVVKQLRAMLTALHKGRAPAKSASDQPASRTPSVAVAARAARSSNLALPRKFNDEERHDFLTDAFAYVHEYFVRSLAELQARNPGVTGRMTRLSPVAFTVVLFRQGKRAAGCHIRIGGGFRSDGIAYSNNESADSNSYNEILSVESDRHMLFLKATMAMFRQEKDRLTLEGAAAHLWDMLLAPLQQSGGDAW